MNSPFQHAPLALLVLGLLSGCARPLADLKQSVAARAGQIEIIHTSAFDLVSASTLGASQADFLRVYIEGDGKAWATRTQPSTDPSPRNLLMANLALADSMPSVYLARPCQFHKSDGCGVAVWTDQRFSAAVIQSFNEAVDKLKARHGANTLQLIGYSGGGYVAMVLAGERDDVQSVQTLAGNLDPAEWIRYHRLSPLSGLRDYKQLPRLQSLPQHHFVGSADEIVPPALVESFVRKYGLRCAAVTNIQATHESGWAGMSKALAEPAKCL